MKLESIVKTLGLPLALIAVIVALLAWAGLTLDQLYVVVGSLVGLQLLGAFAVDVLKYVGVVDPNTAGKWSAAFQLLALIGVAAWLKLWPSFDIYGADAHLLEFVKVASLVFAYVLQVTGAKATHDLALKWVPGFSFKLS
jgi:hypothetical protein